MVELMTLIQSGNIAVGFLFLIGFGILDKFLFSNKIGLWLCRDLEKRLV